MTTSDAPVALNFNAEDNVYVVSIQYMYKYT